MNETKRYVKSLREELEENLIAADNICRGFSYIQDHIEALNKVLRALGPYRLQVRDHSSILLHDEIKDIKESQLLAQVNERLDNVLAFRAIPYVATFERRIFTYYLRAHRIGHIDRKDELVNVLSI